MSASLAAERPCSSDKKTVDKQSLTLTISHDFTILELNFASQENIRKFYSRTFAEYLIFCFYTFYCILNEFCAMHRNYLSDF